MTVVMVIEGREVTGYELWCWFERYILDSIREGMGAEWYAEMARREAEFRPMWDGMSNEERADWVLGGGA